MVKVMMLKNIPVIEEFYDDQLGGLCECLVKERFVSAEDIQTIKHSMLRREKDTYKFVNVNGVAMSILVEECGLTAYRLHNHTYSDAPTVSNLFESLT
jgi:hypothetical protein